MRCVETRLECEGGKGSCMRGVSCRPKFVNGKRKGWEQILKYQKRQETRQKVEISVRRNAHKHPETTKGRLLDSVECLLDLGELISGQHIVLGVEA